jgi:hypothetical protein
MNNFGSGFIIMICVFFILLIRIQLNVQNISKKSEIQINKVKKAKLLKYITADMEETEPELNKTSGEISTSEDNLLEEEIMTEQEESMEEPILCTVM